MGEYLHPGVYVEEKKFGTPPVVGGSTSTGAFVGYTPRVKSEPVFISSWTDFVNQTALGADSPYMKDSYLAYAVYGFFNNGGTRLWLVSATDGTDVKANATLLNGATGSDITFEAQDSGVWGNKLSVKLVAGDKTGLYNVEVTLDGVIVEVHKNVGLGSENNLLGAINQNSKYIFADTDATTIDPTAVDVASDLTGGTDGRDTLDDTHLVSAMKKFDEVDSINLLVIPESQSEVVTTEAVAYAENRKDAVFVADAEMNATFDSVQTFKELFASDFGALYYSWVEVSDPIGTVKKTKFVPSAGHVAGMIARTDANRGVFKAPAGVEAGLRGVVGLKTKINDAQQDILNPKGINVIRAFADTGIVVWGARTMANGYLNVRRELSFVQGAILNSTKWAVFEPNNSDLWRKIRNAVSGFLRGRYALGAYRGESEGEAFFVKCDGELNTVDEINAGRVNTEVGVSINKPGEFIIFRVGQWDGGGAVS
jgi:uncharacterized protein